MATDFVNTYFPASVTSDQMSDTRTRLAVWVKDHYPDLDYRPGSVFGDLFLSPASELIAFLEAGADNLLSDLDLGNVANGIISNCDFITEFLKNFGVTQEYLDGRVSGMIRLIFDQDGAYELDRGLKFIINATDAFYPRLFNEGNLNILPVGQVATPQSNEYVLSQTSSTRYFVDVPVYGFASSDTLDGATFALNASIDSLVSATAIGDFSKTFSESTLPELAKKARNAMFSSSSTTRAGLASAIRQEFPDVTAVSVVTPGDFEMIRSYENGFGVSTPAVDVFVKTNLYGSRAKQVFKINYDPNSRKFWGKLPFAHTPLNVYNVQTTNTSVVGISNKLYTASPKAEFPKLTSAYSTNADYYIVFVMPKNVDGTDAVTISQNSDGTYFQYFEIEYYCDFGLSTISKYLSSSEFKPVGVSIQTRAYIPVMFDQYFVNYKRDKGVIFDTDNSREEIYEYMRTCAYPDIYSDGAVVDSVFYNGGKALQSISSLAFISPSPAQYLITSATVFSLFDIENGAQEIPKYAVSNSSQFIPSQRDDSTVNNQLYSIGVRNTGYIVESASITFKEVV